MQAEQRQKITGYFIEEAKEHLETLEEGIANFQKTVDDSETASDVYRAAHSIKGGAAMLELESIRRTAHRLEDYFKLLKETPVKVDETLKSLCTQILNGLKELVEELERSFTVPEAIASPMMTALEPLFEQAQTHLNQLLHPPSPSQSRTSTNGAELDPFGESSGDELVLDESAFLDTLVEGYVDLNSPEESTPSAKHPRRSSRNPEVGTAELDTLADLFETSELDSLQSYNSGATRSAQQSEADDDIADVLSLSFDEDSSDLGASGSGNDEFLLEEEEEEDISGFLDQLSKNAESMTANQASSPASKEPENEFDFLDEPTAGEDISFQTFIQDEMPDLAGMDELSSQTVVQEEMSDAGEENFLESLSHDLGMDEEDAQEDISFQTFIQDEMPDLAGMDELSSQTVVQEEMSDAGEENFLESLSHDLGMDEEDAQEDISFQTFIQDEMPDLAGMDELSSQTFVQDEMSDAGEENFLESLSHDLGMDEEESTEDISFQTFIQDEMPDLAGMEELSSQTFVQDEMSDAGEENFLESLSHDLGMDEEESTEDISFQTFIQDEMPDLAGMDELSSQTFVQDEMSDAGEENFLESLSHDLGMDEEESTEDISFQTFIQDEMPDFAGMNEENVEEREAERQTSEPQGTRHSDRISSEVETTLAPATNLANDQEGETQWVQDEEEESEGMPAIAIDSSLTYYDHLDELEFLLEQPTPHLDTETLFAQLETLLAEGAPQTEEELIPLPLQAPVTSETKPEGEEDEFSDLEALLRDFDTPAGAPTNLRERARPRARSSTIIEQTLKVPVKQMDNLNNLMGELVVNRNSLEGDEDKLRQSLDTLLHQVQNLSDVAGRMQDLYERSLLEDALLKSRQEYRGQPTIESSYISTGSDENAEGYSSLEMDSFTKFHELAQETIELIVRVRESASDIALWVDDIDLVARSLRQITSQLQEGLTKARMVPFSRTADRLPLAVKKICPQLNKEAQLYLEGKETLIDKMILEHLSDPLTHLVNNSLTHGIEAPEERVAKGKRSVGQITVRALQQGNQTVISVSDDGAGIDPEGVKRKAIEKGLITPGEARIMMEMEVYELLFHPGFSTKDQADNFAGRGVGLDVVRTSISEIRGNVSIESEVGKGTTFTIRLPLTLSISKALCCISENLAMAFPMDGVEDMLDLPKSQVQTTNEGYQFIQWRDNKLHFCLLSELLTYHRKIGRSSLYASEREDEMISVVVLRSATSFLAIGVDRAVGEQEIVIKQINGPVPKPAGIAGATVQGDGRIMAIADVLELIQIAEGRMRPDTAPFWQESAPVEAVPAEQTQPMVLIVDDSITVRSLLSMTFEKAGYQVEQARDGQDAWDKLRGGLPCDIVFCDIEMPRVDGLELLGRMQKDEQLQQLPIAMLTSRGAERHRKIAAELGASGYFTKPYLEEVLLDAAQRMMNGDVLLAGSTRKPGQKPVKSADAATQTSSTPKKPPQRDLQLEAQSTPKVLIVDDSVTVRSLLAMTFEGAGYEVSQARDGQDAWNQLTSGLTPDVAFCDIEMPRMDGIQLLERIQKDETFKEIPVAMITSRGAQKMRQRAAERGASGYFTKPYVEQELLDAAQRLRKGEVLLEGSTRTSRVAEPVEAESPPAPTPPVAEETAPPKVLIVDDSVTVRSLLEATFEGAGYDVTQARDGRDALNQLTSGLKTDLILLDIEMPKMDGLTLLSHLQGDENLKEIPVAMLTSRGAKKMKQRAASNGAKGYFVKPYVDDVLLDAARRLREGEVLLEVEA
ncbi:MAG: response regulator [Cyanobacteriota bacterium]|nr:response regulator [Cyanobacteriota bacterium]